MSVILDYKCPNCGSAVVFDSTSQQFRCKSCDSVFTEEQLKIYSDMLDGNEAKSSYNWTSSGNGETMDNVNTYNCNSCGAEIVTDADTAATSCPYCGSPVVLSQRLSGVNKPDCVIPFKLDNAAAKKALKSFYKGKYLLPKVFKSENKIKEMKSVYVPFWLFGCSANANVMFDATRVTRSWSDSNYNYTEISHYYVFRSATMDFINIPADGSSKMDDAYMESIEPFNYSEMTAFNPAYLSGFLADKYDVDAASSFPRAEARVENSALSAMQGTVHGYATATPINQSVSTSNGFYKYALLPVWMLTSKYGNKNYMFAINGQTGKVSGELPVDKKKLWLTCAAVAAVIAAIGQFFVF